MSFDWDCLWVSPIHLFKTLLVFKRIMKRTGIILSTLLAFAFMVNHPKGRPTSQVVGSRGEKTHVDFNTVGGASIQFQEGMVDESTVFKRIVSGKEGITDWTLDTISPTLIPEDRELAYRYYAEIPGVVWIEKTLFCDETEVSNLDWLEYQQLSGHSRKQVPANPTMRKLNYNSNPQFYFFPVVNISYEEAVDYCKWRSKLVTENYNRRHNISRKDTAYTEFFYHLPTKEQWVKCASFATDTVNYPHVFTQKDLATKIDKNGLDFLRLLGANITEDNLKDFNKNVQADLAFNAKRTTNTYLNLEIPYYIWDYPTNNFGIYNIMGNVSEMTATKGIAMGGSFRDAYEECKVNKEVPYADPSEKVGFRCVCELKWPNKS